MRPESKQRLLTTLRWIISAVALLLVIRYVGPQRLYAQIRSLDLTLLAWVTGLLVAETLLRCWNWQQLARMAGSAGRLRDFIYGYFTGGFVATLLPSTLGADSARSFFVARRIGSKVEVVLATAFALNFLSLIALSLCALTAGALLRVRGHGLSHTSYASLGIGAACIAVAVCVLIIVRSRSNRPPSEVIPGAGARQPLLLRIKGVLERFAAALILIGSGSSADLARTLMLALVTAILRMAGWTALLIAVGAQPSWAALFVLGPALLILAALPISIGGFGGLQAASIFLLAGWGVSPEEAAAWSLLQSALYIVMNVPGSIFFLRGGTTYEPFGTQR